MSFPAQPGKQAFLGDIGKCWEQNQPSTRLVSSGIPVVPFFSQQPVCTFLAHNDFVGNFFPWGGGGSFHSEHSAMLLSCHLLGSVGNPHPSNRNRGLLATLLTPRDIKIHQNGMRNVLRLWQCCRCQLRCKLCSFATVDVGVNLDPD